MGCSKVKNTLKQKKTSILYFIDTLSMVIVSSFNMIYDIIKIDGTVNDSP